MTHLDCASSVARQYAGGQFETFVDPSHLDFAGVAWAAEVVEGAVIVCLEGSHDAPDWVEDFRFLPVEVNGVTLHRGFYQNMPDTWTAIKKFLAGRPFVLCGHSKGAANGDVLAWLAVRDGLRPLAYVRWGEPGPAYGSAFGAALWGIPGASYRNVKPSPRYASEVDLVTAVPIFGRHPQEFTDVYAPPDAEACKWGLLSWHHFGLYLSVTPETVIER